MQYDAALLNAIRHMEGETLAEIVDEYSPALHTYVRHSSIDPCLADNIVGDVFACLQMQPCSMRS